MASTRLGTLENTTILGCDPVCATLGSTRDATRATLLRVVTDAPAYYRTIPLARRSAHMARTDGAIGIDAHVFLTLDLAQSVAFYAALLDLEPARRDDLQAEFDFRDGSTFAISTALSDEPRTFGGIMFSFDDVERALERALALGATLALHDRGAGCTTAWCFDPDGNTFALHRRHRAG